MRACGWLVCAIAHPRRNARKSACCPTRRIAHGFGNAQSERRATRNLAPVDAVIRPGEQFLRGCSLQDHPRNLIMNKFTRISVLVGAVALTALAGCASTQNHEGTGQYVDDTAITTKVKAAIFNAPELKSSEINVETFKGRVQLSGFVRSQSNINEAVAIAQGVTGVVSVGNDMRLK
jgi:osmotically-inducible protein OsmY